MDFSFSQQQIDLHTRFSTFAAENLSDKFHHRDSHALFDRDLWRSCASVGVLDLVMPEEYSGTPAATIQTGVRAMEGLGYGSIDNGMPFALNTHIWTVQFPLLEHGTAEQKACWLPAMCRGDVIGCHAMTEPEAGSDSSAIQMTAVPTDGGYLLNGEKCMITLAPVADMFLLLATVDAQRGKWGITAFLLDRQSEGISVSPALDKMGLRTVPMGNITLNNCFVPHANRLGPEGAGASIANHSLELERCCILASQLGRMQKQLEDAVAFARERRQFGQAIGSFQSVSNRIADMQVRLETARLLLQKVAWLKDHGQPATLESAMLKLYVSEQFLASSMDAIRVRGGRGYIESEGVTHDTRDAMGGVLYAGTSDIQRNIIAGMLGL